MGNKIPAGRGFSTVMPDLDFETYSEAGCVWREGTQKWVAPKGSAKKSIFAVGAAVYAEHPSTEVLCLFYDLKDGVGPELWTPHHSDPPFRLLEHVGKGLPLEAWNSMFEFLIWSHVCTRLYGWPAIPREQIFCAAAKSRRFGLPGKLEIAANVVGKELKHAADGKRMLNRYSIPRNPTKNDLRLRIDPWEDGLEGIGLYSYCRQDIVSEASVSSVCPDLDDKELAIWRLDQRINLRGVPVDMPAVVSAVKVLDYMEIKYNAEMARLTNGDANTCSEVAAIQNNLWMNYGLRMHSLDDEAVTTALKGELHPTARRILLIRKKMASAGAKKLRAMQRLASYDNRVRDQYIYHGPHTGRWSSGGLQLHNMKSSGPDLHLCPSCQVYYGPGDFDCCTSCGTVATAEKAESWSIESMTSVINTLHNYPEEPANVETILGDQTLDALAGSIRGLICAPAGKDFLCSDYSAIEAVVLAALAGEEWRLEVFRTHGKIYEQTAADITGKTLQYYIDYYSQNGGHHSDRKPFGKIPELASGYAGWIGAWKAFGADEFFDDDAIKDKIKAWRAKSPMIVELWGGQWRKHPDRWEFSAELYGLEGMAISAVLNPGHTYRYRLISYLYENDILYAQLPSGRLMHYHQPRLAEVQDRFSKNMKWDLSYMTYNTNPMKGKIGWVRVHTYGGMLTENVTQAVARDIFAHGMLNVEAAGYPLMLHTHDEMMSEVDEGFGSVEEYERLMCDLPAWCNDWPIRAEGGWRGKRYRK